jgi:membrane protein
MAAAMAYYTAFSLFPLILVLVSIVGFALRLSQGANNVQDRMIEVLGQQSSPELARQFTLVLSQVKAHAGINGPIGLVILLVGAIAMFSQLEQSFDRIWEWRRPTGRGWRAAIRNALVVRFRAFALLLGLGFALLVAFGAVAVLASVRNYAQQFLGQRFGSILLETAASLAINTLVFAAMYRGLPRASVAWRDALLGALVAGITWEIGRAVLATCVVGKKYDAYGVVGAFMAIMLWTYYASTVLFLGAEVAHAAGALRDEQNTVRQPLPS